jgi:hypothetical protein
MQGKAADYITIKVGHGIMTIPRKPDKNKLCAEDDEVKKEYKEQDEVFQTTSLDISPAEIV